jgi:hypothetical protein
MPVTVKQQMIGLMRRFVNDQAVHLPTGTLVRHLALRRYQPGCIRHKNIIDTHRNIFAKSCFFKATMDFGGIGVFLNICVYVILFLSVSV